jgi:hypothetical protein
MNLPPQLNALARLVEAFHDEPTLGQLRYDLHLVVEALRPLGQAAEDAARAAAGPAPAVPVAAAPVAGAPVVPAPAPADFEIADRLRGALGTYVAKPGPRAGWVPCRTPGCRDGWRGQ